jgi:hypothetical protein
LLLLALLIFSIADFQSASACSSDSPSQNTIEADYHSPLANHEEHAGCDVGCGPVHCHVSHCSTLSSEIRPKVPFFYNSLVFGINSLIPSNFPRNIFRPPIA